MEPLARVRRGPGLLSDVVADRALGLSNLDLASSVVGRPARACLAALALALLAGCPGGGASSPDAEALAGLDPAIRRVAGLEAKDWTELQSTWFAGVPPLTLARGVSGWEVVDGQRCARVGLVVRTKEHEGEAVTEWLRPAGDRLLCPARALRGRVMRLEPPQPLLVAPLAPGQTWTWQGTVDGAPASLDVLVRHAGERDLDDGTRRFAVELLQTIRAGGFEVTRTQVWAEGRGVALEEGALPTPDVEALDPFRAAVGPLLFPN